MSSKLKLAEYIWTDGTTPTRGVRSKARVVMVDDVRSIGLHSFPEWSFDGSSTNQAPGNNSDCLLHPVSFRPDPIRGEGNFLVMCEVFNPDGTPHKSNSRAQLRKVLDEGGAKSEPWAGFEQEYTLFQGKDPYNWPNEGFPGPQGPYYCSVGADNAWGRELVERHTEACMEAGLLISGINAEVMPSQWEFQIGYRGVPTDTLNILDISDDVWYARWLLYRLGEDYGIQPSFSNKPVKGDWNGAGCHCNFSTKETRDSRTGKAAIENAIKALSQSHDKHIAVYGHANEERLTGKHETCSIREFRSGVADRGSSIRIPQQVHLKGYGYFEDRRPGANCDPYLVAARLVATVCGIDDKHFTFNWS